MKFAVGFNDYLPVNIGKIYLETISVINGVKNKQNIKLVNCNSVNWLKLANFNVSNLLCPDLNDSTYRNF